MNGPARDLQIDPADRHEAREFLRQILRFENDLAAHDAIAPPSHPQNVACPWNSQKIAIRLRRGIFQHAAVNGRNALDLDLDAELGDCQRPRLLPYVSG